jgi:hypothetical protein
MMCATILIGQKVVDDVFKIADPNVASFNKFIEHPVNTYNGSVSIDIPVYTIKDGIIDYPIVLRYNSSGITVAEEASWVGLGWNLDVGGYVQQNIIGTQDISTEFKNADNDLKPNEVDFCSSYSVTLNDLNNKGQTLLNAANNKLKPDIFTYSFLGHSGKFYIDYRDNSVHQFKEDESLQIESYQNGSVNGWKIIDEDGTQYFFDFVGSTMDNSGVTTSVTNYLTDIIFTNGQKMHFQYKNTDIFAKNLPTYNITYFGKFNEDYFPDNNHQQYNYGGAFLQYTDVTLDKIVTDNLEIDFETSPRIDIDKGYQLDYISVKQLNTSSSIQRKFKFDYDYFVSPIEGNYWQGTSFDLEKATHRLKLNAFYEEGLSDKYEFTYNPVMLPIKTSFAVDYWGYYNGQITNTTLLPRLSYMNNVDKSVLSDNVLNAGANRAFNPETAGACMLYSIKYPTGGLTKFNYEPHTFSPNILPTVQEISDQDTFSKITPVQISDHNYESATSYCFDILYEMNVKIDRNISKGQNTWQDMLGSTVSIVKIGDSPTLIDSWNLQSVPADDPDNITSTFLQKLAPGHYCVSVNLPDVLGNNYDSGTKHGCVSASIYIPPQVPPVDPPKYSKGGGMRKSIVHDESLNNGNKTVTYYDYEDNTAGTSYGVLLAAPYPCQKIYNVHYWYDDDQYDKCAIQDLQENEFEIRGNVIQPLSFSSVGGNIGYSEVIEHIEDQTTINAGGSSYPLGHTVYKYNNSSSTSCSNAPVIPSPLNGTLWETCFYDKNNNLVSQQFIYET